MTASAPKPQTISGCQASPHPPVTAKPRPICQPQACGLRGDRLLGPRLGFGLPAAVIQSWGLGSLPPGAHRGPPASGASRFAGFSVEEETFELSPVSYLLPAESLGRCSFAYNPAQRRSPEGQNLKSDDTDSEVPDQWP